MKVHKRYTVFPYLPFYHDCIRLICVCYNYEISSWNISFKTNMLVKLHFYRNMLLFRMKFSATIDGVSQPVTSIKSK